MKKLLIKLRDYLLTYGMNNYFSGLCLIPFAMVRKDIISREEKTLLRKYIKSHRPKRGKHFVKNRKHSNYYWTPSDIKPRIAWLNYRIKKERY